MNGKRFVEEANVLRKIVKLPEYKKEQLTVCTYKEYITDKKKNFDILYSFYKKNQITLVIADAGKGKTYTVSKLNQRLYSDSLRKKGLLKGSHEDYDLPFLDNLEGTSPFVEDYTFTEGLGDFKEYKPNSDEILPWHKDGSFNQEFLEKSKERGLEEVDLGIIICPSKNQNHQNEENTEYQMIALTADNKQIKKENLLKEDKTISAVFEKIGEFKTLYKSAELEGIKVKISLTIDEAHLLVEQLNFRDKALNEINEMTDLILKNNGSVLMLTATPQSLMLFNNISSIVDFREEETEIKPISNNLSELDRKYINCKPYKAPAGKIEIAYNLNNDVNMLDFTADILKGKGYFHARYNSIKNIEKIQEYFHKRGECVLTADGSQKEREILEDGTKSYKNEIFHSIITNECLPKYTRDGQEVRGNATTSSLEVGTNNKGIGEMKGDKIEIAKDPNFAPIYVCDNSRQSYVSNMIQFFNRARFYVNAYTIISKYDGIKPIIPIEEITEDEYSKVEKSLEQLNKYKELFQTELSDKDELIHRINQFLEITYTDSEKIDLNCIYLDTEVMELKIDYNALFKKVYDKFYQQYFYNIVENIRLVEEEFGLKVLLKLYASCNLQINNFFKEILTFYNIPFKLEGLNSQRQHYYIKKMFEDNFNVEIYIVQKKDCEDIELIKVEENDVIKVLEDMKGNPDMQEEVIEGDIKNIDILKIQDSPLYKKLEELVNYNVEIKEALSLVIEKNNKNIVEAKYESLKGRIEKFTDNDFNDLVDIIQKKKRITDTSINIAKTINHIMENRTLKEALKRAIIIELDKKTIIDLLKNSRDVSTFNLDITKRQFIYFNKIYKKMKVVPSIEQQIVLDNLYMLNESGNVKETKIDSIIIDKLQLDLEEGTGKKYNKSEVKKLINLCFVVNQKNSKIRDIRLYIK